MRFATWNLNNRVGKVRFRTEAADAALALDADVVVLTEYFPNDQHKVFCRTLVAGGLVHQVLTREPPERANRVLVASRTPLISDPLPLPNFDHQFPANVVAVGVESMGLRLLGVRVPCYAREQRVLLTNSWDWLESTAAALSGVPSAILGDLNVGLVSRPSSGGGHFRRMLKAGWTRAAPEGGHTFYGHRGSRSEIDHLLISGGCSASGARYVTAAGGFVFAGAPGALSDHAAIVADITLR